MEKNKKYLNQLSEINNNNGIRFSHYAAGPGAHCPMHTALASIKSIPGVSSLVVGMPECGFYSRYVMDQPVGRQGELHYVYVLDSNEVVFGCREGLKEALHLMVKDGVKAIFIIMTCIPALIGEDIQEIGEEIREETGVKAVCIDMAHFKRNGYESGYYEVYGQILSFIKVEERESEDEKIIKEKKKNEINLKEENNCKEDIKFEAGIEQYKRKALKSSVNILGDIKSDEGKELENLLLHHSYEILKVVPGVHYEILTSIMRSKLSIVTNLYALPLAKRLKEEYQIPYVLLSGSYSPENIVTLYESIFSILKINETVEMFSFHKSIFEFQKVIERKVFGMNFVITSILSDVLSITAYLSSLSMNPLLLHIEEYKEWMKEWKDEILEYKKNPYVTYLVKKEGLQELLKLHWDDHKESLIINSWKKKLLSFGNLSTEISCYRVEEQELRKIGRLFGFERTNRLLSVILHSLEENENAAI